MSDLLKVENLNIAFGDTPVVKNVNFSIGKGEILALVGESGSGKTLTALSVMGLLPRNAAVSGGMEFRGEERGARDEIDPRSSTLAPIRRGKDAAMIFQEPMTALNPLHTIRRQIDEMLSIHQPLMNRKAREARIHELLEQVGLSHLKERLDAYPHQLSGGERQRVMIATAIANNPQLLIADEPTTAVDVTIQKQILALIKTLQKETGLSVLLITHDLTIVRRVAERVAIMKQGELVEMGDTKAIFDNPQHPYTQKLLASEPKGEPRPCLDSAPLLLALKDVSVRFPLKKGLFLGTKTYKTAVEGASLQLHESETLGIVGESGSGKSSLGYAILRLVKSEGEILFLEGRGSRVEDRIEPASPLAPRFSPLHSLPSSAMRPLRKELQIVFQDPFSSLNPRMTVRDIIAEGLLVHEPGGGDHESRIDAALTEVGLSPDLKGRYAHEFSGGQRQRIAIARAMVLRPRLLILDEPTSALDLTIQSQILALLSDLQQKHKTAYIFISHDLRVVRAIAHRIAVMKEGRIVETGDTKKIFAAPEQDYTRRLIDAAFLV